MNAPNPAYRNLPEPPALLDLFASFPPSAFTCRLTPNGLPVFEVNFNLLTTLDAGLRTKLMRLPFTGFIERLATRPTTFCGTTLTEYTPLPAALEAGAMLDALQAECRRGDDLLIIKDLPCASPLLLAEDNLFADELAAAARERGFLELSGQALAYVPLRGDSEKEYLARLSTSRRKDLRRKLRKRGDIELEILPIGDPFFADQTVLAEIYSMYLEVFKQSEIHFDLLSPEFFAALLQNRNVCGAVMLYRHQGLLAGWNICLEHNGLLIDKYIGLRYPLARELNLYFISWFENLAYARQRGLSCYVAGWTDPEVKASLGASFTFTRHLVQLRSPLLRGLLRPLRSLFESDRRIMEDKA